MAKKEDPKQTPDVDEALAKSLKAKNDPLGRHDDAVEGGDGATAWEVGLSPDKARAPRPASGTADQTARAAEDGGEEAVSSRAIGAGDDPSGLRPGVSGDDGSGTALDDATPHTAAEHSRGAAPSASAAAISGGARTPAAAAPVEAPPSMMGEADAPSAPIRSGGGGGGAGAETANTPAHIAGLSPADLTEDGAVDSVTGLLVVADADPGESRFQAGTTTGVDGVFEIDGDGLWRYQLGNSLASVQSLQAGDAVRETITVHSVDGTPHQMVFTVHGAADAPVLVAEAQTLTEGGRRISGRMIALDADAGDQLTFSSHTPIPGFTLHSDGSYTFDPSVPAYDALGPNARQIVSIPVTVTDSTGLSDTKALEITVTGSNDGPTLSLTPPQSLLEGAPVYRGRFTAQDVDAGDSLTYGLTQPVPGMSLSPDGAFRFDAGDPAFDHLAFGDKLVMSVPVTVTDRQGASDTQVMEIAVVGTNDAPMLSVAPPQTVDEGAGAVHGRFVATDVDDGDVLTFGAAQSVPGFTIAPDGSYRFDPTVSAYDHLYAGEQQVLSIPVTVRDAHGASDQQIVQITVTGTNDVPIVAGLDHSVAALSGATNGHATASGSLAVLDLDSGESHFAGQVLSGHYGTLAISADGTWTYSADANQKAFTQMPQGGHLEETFTVRTADGTSHDITVRIVGSNQPAIIAGTRQALVQEDQPGTIAHRLTIADPDAHQAAFQPVDQDLKYGHFTLSADGGWTYRVDNGNPAVQALGAGDPLVERIMVGSVDGTPQVIEVTIVGANDAPVIGGVNTATLSEDVAATGGRLAASGRLTIQDVDAGEARFTPFQGFPGDQGYGTFAIDVDGVWTYEVDNSQPAVQQLKPHERIADSVSAISADGSRHTITVIIEGTNDAPVLQAQSQSVTEDGAVLHGRMQASDVDSGDTHSFSTTATVPGFTLNADGSYSFDPSDPAYQHLPDGQSQALTIPVTVADAYGATSTQDLKITVTGAQDAAVISEVHLHDHFVATEDVGVNQSGKIQCNGNLAVSDADAGEGVFPLQHGQATYGTYFLAPSGAWSYTADNAQAAIQELPDGHSLTDSFTIHSRDGTAHTVTVTIEGTNDAPIVQAQSQSVTEDGAVLHGRMQASDVDSGDTQSFSTTATVPGFTLNADGSYSFDPSDPAYQHLPDGQGQALTIPVTVADGSGATSTADLTITLTGTNDGPRIAGDLSKATPDDDSAITGTLSVADADTGESAFQAVQDVQGRYGTFSLTADGHWTYTPDDRADAIAPGRTQQEDFTVHSVDGTARTVSVTVTGSSDQSLAGDTTGAVSEDGTVTLSGDLTIRDDGGGVSTPHFGDHVLAGTYGSLDLRDQGHWIYNLDNQSPAVQGLKDGQVEEERFHITLPDGTTEDVVIRVTGTGDAPVIQTSAVQPPATLTDVDQITDFTGATDLSAFSELNQGVPVGTRIVGLYMPGSDQNLLANIAQGDLPTTHAAYDMGNFQAAGAGYQYLDQNQWFGQNLEGGTARFHALAPSVRNNFDGGLIVFDDGTVGRLVKVCDDDRANGPGDYVYFNKVNGVDAHTGVSVLSGKGTAGETVEVYEGTQRIGTATVDAQGYWRLGVPKLSDGDHEIHTVVAGAASEPQTVTVAGAQTDIHDPVPVLGAVTEDDAAAHSLSGQMTVTDADANDHPVFAAQQDTDGAYGTFSIDADGAWRYTLDNGRAATQALPDGQSVHETFIVEVATDSGETAAQSVQVTVTGANDAPALSVPAARTVAEDAAAISGQLTGSDADAGDTLSFSLATTVAGFALSADGSYTFDPSDPAYQNLPDGQQQVLTIPITVSDSSGATSTQNLVVTVTGANDAPTATAAPVTLAEDAAPVSGRIAGADPDSGETLTYSTTAAVPGFVLNADGGYSFDPSDAAYQGLAAGASHPITIPITVTDGAGAQATQDLVITVTGANDAPVVMATFAAPADLGATTEDTPTRFSEADLLRLVGASDADGSDSLTIAGISSPHGAFTRGASGDWVFTPAADYHGDAVDVTVRVSDGVAETTAHATIDVTPVTDAAQPALTVRAEQQVMEFSSGSGSGVVNAGVIQAGGAMHGLTVDMTILGGQQVTSSAGHGATLISYATPSDDNAFYIWRPENMKFRIGGVEYETGVALLSDGQDHRYTFSWDGDQGTLDVLIDGRVAAHLDNIGRGATLADGGKFAIGNDQDSFGGGFSSNDAFTGQIFNTAIAKTAVPAADLERSALANLLDGDPDLLTNIQAEGGQFRDSTGNYHYSAVGTVGTSTVEVDTQIATPNPGATLKFALDPGAPSDGDDHVSAQTLAGFPAGTIVSDGSGHSITVTDSSEAVDVTGWTLASLQATPPVSFHGNMNIAYSVTTEGPDGTTETALDHAPVVLDPTQPIPDATIAGDDDATTPDDDAAVSGVLTIADADGSQAHFLAQTETAGLYGKFSIDAQGAWSYAPDDRADALADGASASESFTVSSADGTTHRVTIAVTGSNDAPTANAASVSTTEDAASFTGSIAGADPDSGETLTYTTTAPVPGFALDPDGGYSFDPSDAAYQGLAAGASHPITIPITVTDGAGAQVTHDLVITLTGANDAPVVTATSAAPASLGATDEDTPITFSEADLLRLVGASDADAGDTLHITAATSAQGSFAQQPDGSWVFTPARDFSGDDVAVTLTVSDGAADVTAQGVLDIAPTADRPSLQVGASAGGVVYGRADFSAASAAVHFDLTTQDYQSPGQGLRPGRYAVTSATGGGADDTFRVSTLQDGDSYTIDGGAGRNTLDLSAYRADQVAIDTATGVATVTLDGGGSATVHFSNIAELRFDSAVFDGTPHAIEPVHGAWTVEGTSLSVAGGASKQVALADYAGALQADYTLAATVHAHTNGGMNKTGGIVFDYQDEDNFKMAVLRAGQGGWNIEEYRNGQLVELERVSDATMATPDADHQVELRVHGSVAELWSGGELKASHDFGTPLNGGRFGVVSDGGQTDFQLAMQPSDWAPAAPDVDARMDVSDGALGIPNVLDQAVDHEGAALSLSAFDAASAHGGRVASNGDGSFRYEPPPGFSGADSFTYTITDGVNETTATVRVNVVDLHTVRHVTPGDSFELDISAAGNDQDGSEQVETRIVGLPDGAVVSDGTHTGAIDADHPLDVTGWRLDSIEIAPPAGQTENYAFSVESRSVDGDSASPWSGAALRVELQPGQPFPDAAIAGDDSAATADDDTSVSGSLSVSDSDAADAHFVAQTDTDGQYGTFSIDDQGQWTYAPDDRADALADGTNATESFTVKSADGTTHTVDIEVTGSDEAGSQAAPPSAPPTSSSVTDYMQFAAPGSQNPSGSDEAGEDGQGDSAVTVYLEVAGIDPSDAAPGAGSSDASGPSDDPQLYNRGDASADDALTDTDGRVDDAALDGAETDPVEAAIQDDPQHHGF